MPLHINQDLTTLMEHFYVLTGLRMVLFDEYYHELLAYPMDGTPFCVHMRQNGHFDKQCHESDRISFERCRKTHELTVYKCHAGLIEATAPLMADGKIIGYVMFGQITDIKDKDELLTSLRTLVDTYANGVDLDDAIRRIKCKSTRQILAASKILEACANYILLKELIKPTDKAFFDKIEQFILEHISEDITVERLCREFHISRTNLYAALRPHIDGGIAAYIRRCRLTTARDLLKKTDLPIADIAARVGFDDYNYFLRVFKKTYGASPKRMR